MASRFIEAYYKYFLWNESLLKHFFGNKNVSEVVLNISAETLKEIVQNDIDLKKMLLSCPNSIIGNDEEKESLPDEADWYRKIFYGTVELFCQYYNEYIVSCIKPINLERSDVSTCREKDECSNYRCISKDNRKDVLAVANHIIEKKIAYYKIDYKINNEGEKIPILRGVKNPSLFSLPCFAIAIYIIMKFDDGEEQKWENISDIDIFSHKYIVKFWNSIHTYDNRFDSDATIYENTKRKREDYVGRVKYHLPLSRKEIRLLKDAIYATGVWRRYDEMSFSEIILELSRELEYQGYEEWKKILGALGSNKVLQRKVGEQVELFNEDKYKEDRENRKRDGSVTTTKLRGEFVLGLYYPEDENEENKIVLLTTISEDLKVEKGKKHNAYEIKGCGDEFYRNRYNRNFVKVNDADSLKIKDYSCRNSNVKICQMRIDDVVFFYEYSKNLYIQTREIILKPSYIVAVKDNEETIEKFKSWCENSNNQYKILTSDNVKKLYGDGWKIYFFKQSLNVNYQYYEEEKRQKTNIESTEFAIKGGIKDNNGRYFINALPYIEVPRTINITDVNLYFGIDGKEGGCKRIDKCNKIIIDVDANAVIAENSICYITAENSKNKENRIHSDFKLTTKNVQYEQENLHKYNSFAQLIYEGNASILQGNQTSKSVLLQGSIIKQDILELESIDESFYFVNLLAACCFDSQNSEITKDMFRKCASYAATRLGIDEGQDGFMQKLRYLLSSAGFISVDYSRSNYRYQAIPPAFSRVQVCNIIAQNTQMIMLSGCYSRKFINDLLDYCQEQKILVYKYTRPITTVTDIEKFLPPIILLQYNFQVANFVKEKGHQCDDLSTIDLSSSIIDSISDIDIDKIQGILNLEFEKIDTQSLEKTYTEKFPRIRKRFVNGNRYYIENEQNELAILSDNSLLPWANIYCGLMKNNPIVSMKGTKLYVAKKMQLPTPILRALYMVSLGLPNTKKVFISNNKGSDKYYHEMNVYDCLNKDISKKIVEKLKGKEALPNTKYYSMEFWSLDQKQRLLNENNRCYLLLKKDNDIIAMACGKSVYINRDGVYYMINGKMNEVFSYLIEKPWIFMNGNKIGIQTNGGTQTVGVGYSYSTTDVIQFPPKNENDYTKENIEII